MVNRFQRDRASILYLFSFARRINFNMKVSLNCSKYRKKKVNTDVRNGKQGRGGIESVDIK